MAIGEKGRILAIDPGQKKIGLAVSDPTQTIAQPFAILAADSDLWKKLQGIISAEAIILVVVGIPRGMRGDTDQTEWSRDFIKELRTHIEIPIDTFSEIFTTKIAQAQRSHLPKVKRQQADDADAAAVMLQDYLEGKNF